jgi:hypothetical protein
VGRKRGAERQERGKRWAKKGQERNKRGAREGQDNGKREQRGACRDSSVNFLRLDGVEEGVERPSAVRRFIAKPKVG